MLQGIEEEPARRIKEVLAVVGKGDAWKVVEPGKNEVDPAKFL
jgi:hypothetical protein